MAHSAAGMLGSVAMCLVIANGLLNDRLPDSILSQCLVVFPLFAGIGFCIGKLAAKTVSDSVENRFRSEMASLHAGADQPATGRSEH